MEKKQLGDVTTINITALQSGVSRDGGKTHALNEIPTEAIAEFDIRVSPEMEFKAMEAKLDEWCAAGGVSWESAPWTAPLHQHFLNSLDADNVWRRYLRKVGVPAIVFSPMKQIEILLHKHNERLQQMYTFIRT
ncbi:hypothetical protein BBJ29_008292 [Phytophthora kernoviae]|uniref:Peptidase M20 dimerisation domain-containing protein n=1 Tax=Phytophthora kernoviae TaxID=325452 RepID=A0A3F2RF41_9STRA|nr:hypothetical protein BBP00_00008554 [Phytophthora kernoviae]RLN65584.1 hypothetical protein BBJ29_008292 [Phytophthora kernoviae]